MRRDPVRIPAARARKRGLGLAVLALLPLLANGCAVPLMGHRMGFPERGAKVRETGLQKNLRETREAAALAPAVPYWPYHLAELYADADSLALADAAIDQALARDPAYAPALALRSRLDYHAGRHDRAIRAIEAALARPDAFPDGPPRALLEGLALHYEAIGQGSRADAVLARLAPDPKHASPVLVYFQLLSAEPATAGDGAERVVRDEPKSAANQNNYGITRLRAGDPEGARASFEKAIDLDPSLPGPYYNLAILEKYYLFHDDRAAAYFDAYWKRSQLDPDGLAAVFGKSTSPKLASDGD